jgi:acetylornithine/succinyldiaminopimelate/putrescine aminotransferase
VLALGHGHPCVKAAVHAQVDELMHTSNLYRVPVQTALAQALVDLYQARGVFLCNSGTEANEGAIKLIRKHHWRLAGSPESGVAPRTEVLVLPSAFHGRTLMSLAMTPKPAYQQGYLPLPGPVRALPADELPAAVSEQTAAVFVEPVQGEGGCRALTDAQLRAIRAACDRTGALLVYDEIQCGLGRTGEIVHHPRPDLITLAKAVGGGLPLGAILVVNPALEGAFTPGDHGTTFGGNPVACAAGLATIQTIVEEDLPARCAALGDRLTAQLEAAGFTVRGRGLIRAAVPQGPSPGEVVARMRARGVLVCPAGVDSVRFLPPFTSTEAEIDELAQAFVESAR